MAITVNRLLTTLLVLLVTLPASGCDLIGDVLEFGFWLIVILIAVIVLLVWAVARMLRGRTGRAGDRRPPPGP